jgi:integrase
MKNPIGLTPVAKERETGAAIAIATKRKRLGGLLTPAHVNAAKGENKKYRLPAGDPKALNLVVMPTGSKYWVLRYRYGDKPKEVTVGKPYPTTSLADARKRAKALLVEIDSGFDPAERRKQERLSKRDIAEHTFVLAANSWHEFHSKHWKPATAAQSRMYLDKDLIPCLGKRPLANITTKELSSMLDSILARGAPDVVKKVRQWLESIFGYARGKGWTTVDPVKDLHEVTQHLGNSKNYPHLPLSELPGFLKELDSIDASPFVKGVVNLVLWTANRPGITRSLRWSELDLDKAEWTVPKGREGMKRGYEHVVPLPKQAVAMLRELHQASGSFEHVFIGRNDPTKSISDGAVNVLLKRIGYRGKQTTHGFRHLISTALNDKGYKADWIERQLAHGDPNNSRDTYNKAKYMEERRPMMQAWADEIDAMRMG